MSNPTPPPGTRLVLMSENLLAHFGTADANGNRLSFEWGEPDENGWYTITVRTSNTNLADLVWEARHAAERLTQAIDAYDRETRP